MNIYMIIFFNTNDHYYFFHLYMLLFIKKKKNKIQNNFQYIILESKTFIINKEYTSRFRKYKQF